MAVKYYTDDCSYRLPRKRLTAEWLRRVAEAEGYELGDVSYIFCSAQRLLEMNRQYLGHASGDAQGSGPRRTAPLRSGRQNPPHQRADAPQRGQIPEVLGGAITAVFCVRFRQGRAEKNAPSRRTKQELRTEQ